MYEGTTQARVRSGRDRAGTQRLSFAPLEELHDGTLTELSFRCGVPRRTLYRWREYGLTAWQADLCAIRIGFHPLAVWGGSWADVVDDEIERWGESLANAWRRPVVSPAVVAMVVREAGR